MYKNSCQFLRSSCGWSTGIDRTEASIMNAYLEVIEKAKNFIYIENQYFISGISAEDAQNPILEKLIDKLIEKITSKQKFRIIILIPVVPEDPGDIKGSDGNTKRLLLELEYKSISRGDNSILGQLSKHTDNISEYILFLSLRNHGVSPKTGQPHTNGIYVHSKLLIVDDDWMIFGSANINDRSMLGNRDSEIVMITYDNNRVEGIMDDKPIEYSNTVHQFRKKIFMNTFSMTEHEVQDP